jgi:hypothetical protein
MLTAARCPGRHVLWRLGTSGQLGVEGGSDRCTLAGSQASDKALRHGSEEMKQQAEAFFKPCTPRPVAVQGGFAFARSPWVDANVRPGSGVSPILLGPHRLETDQASTRPVMVGG